MIIYDKCPLCNSPRIKEVLQVTDFSVSGQVFPVYFCENCTGRFTQNVPDQSEIGKYYQFSDYISHTDTRKGIINQLYHRVRKITLDSKKRMIAGITGKSAGRLLDYGSGTGAFLHHMKSAGWEVSGIEPDPGAREKGKELYNLSTTEPDSLKSIPSESFDVITLWHVLEHVHDLHPVLFELHRILRPGGFLFIAVPNYTSDDAAAYGAYWAAWDVPRHLYHFSPESMKKLLAISQFTLINIKPMWFDSFYVSMLSEKYKTGKTQLPGAFLHGLLSNSKALLNKGKCSSLIYIAKKESVTG